MHDVMPKKLLLAALPLAALALSGCQALFGNENGAQMAEVSKSEIDMTSYYAQRLAAGRQHLERGQVAAAANAFRQASYHPQYAAQAYNGMAIAYDRLGRDDLAERFFGLAIKTDPSEAAYARNFAMFRDEHPVSPEARPAMALAEVDPVAAPTIGAGITAESRDERSERLSNREVRLHSKAPAAIAQTADSGSSPMRQTEINVQARARQLAQAREVREASPTYPVRFDVAHQSSSARELFTPRYRPARGITRSAPSRGYPVRVVIPSS